MTRPCVILVADSNMAAVFRGYFSRDRWDLSLQCAPFNFDCAVGGDLIVAEGGNDPGVYVRAHELLRPFQPSHQRALVVLDAEWEGSPGKALIEQHITANLISSGWVAAAVKVIAIEPELENWLWQDNPNVAQVLRYRKQLPLRQLLTENNWWPQGVPKPPRPKEATEWVLRQTGQPRSSSIYQQLAAQISTRGCSDPAFEVLRGQLHVWFPSGGEE